jgi:hypothetical protein
VAYDTTGCALLADHGSFGRGTITEVQDEPDDHAASREMDPLYVVLRFEQDRPVSQGDDLKFLRNQLEVSRPEGRDQAISHISALHGSPSKPRSSTKQKGSYGSKRGYRPGSIRSKWRRTAP